MMPVHEYSMFQLGNGFDSLAAALSAGRILLRRFRQHLSSVA